MKKAVFVYKCKMCGSTFYEDAFGLAFDTETDELMVLEDFEIPLNDNTHRCCGRETYEFIPIVGKTEYNCGKTTYEFTPITGKAEYIGIGWVEEQKND